MGIDRDGSPRSPSSGERLREIGDEVGLVLDADGEADEAVADAERRARFRRYRSVRHDRRMLDQALDAAEALGQREDLAALEEAARVVEAALEDRRHHAAEAAHLPLGQRMLRMARKARIVDAGDLGMLLQPRRDRGSILAMALHAQPQRLHAAQGEEAVER